MNIKKMMKKMVGISLVGVISFSLISCGATDKKEVASGMDKEVITLGFDNTFVPMGFKDDNGEYTGFDIDLAKEVSKKIGKEIKFQPIEWKMKETELNNGNIDLIWNGFSITDERKEKLTFSNVYMENRQVIITLAGSDIKTKADLKDKKVAAQDQSSAVDAIGNYKDNFKELVTFSTNDEALRDLEAGRVDAVVADEPLIRYIMKLKGSDKYNVLDEDFGEEEYAIGMRKDDEKLIEAINKGLKETIEDGTASEISKKWFGADIIKK